MIRRIVYRVKLTNQQPVDRILDVRKDSRNYNIDCVNSANERLGSISFCINEDKTWIYKIKINEEYLHQGVGTALLSIMEYISMLKRVTIVEAKYFPENKFARPFYEKNGYFVPNKTKDWACYDDTWTMYKLLDYSKVRDKIEKNILKFMSVELKHSKTSSSEECRQQQI